MLHNDLENNRSYNKRNILKLSSDNLLYEIKDESNRYPFIINLKVEVIIEIKLVENIMKRKIYNNYYFNNDNYEDNNNINDNLINN
jgi:hypothetical protein